MGVRSKSKAKNQPLDASLGVQEDVGIDDALGLDGTFFRGRIGDVGVHRDDELALLVACNDGPSISSEQSAIKGPSKETH